MLFDGVVKGRVIEDSKVSKSGKRFAEVYNGHQILRVYHSDKVSYEKDKEITLPVQIITESAFLKVVE